MATTEAGQGKLISTLMNLPPEKGPVADLPSKLPVPYKTGEGDHRRSACRCHWLAARMNAEP